MFYMDLTVQIVERQKEQIALSVQSYHRGCFKEEVCSHPLLPSGVGICVGRKLKNGCHCRELPENVHPGCLRESIERAINPGGPMHCNTPYLWGDRARLWNSKGSSVARSQYNLSSVFWRKKNQGNVID